jgi:hypothetical protein
VLASGVAEGTVMLRYSLGRRLAAVFVIIAALGAATLPAQRSYRDLYNTYYATLVSEREDILSQFTALAATVDYNNPPTTLETRDQMIAILVTWGESRRHFLDVTAKDDDPRIAPIRAKYLESDDEYTYALLEWLIAIDPSPPLTTRQALFAESARAFTRATELSEQARAMAARALAESE